MLLCAATCRFSDPICVRNVSTLHKATTKKTEKKREGRWKTSNFLHKWIYSCIYICSLISEWIDSQLNQDIKCISLHVSFNVDENRQSCKMNRRTKSSNQHKITRVFLWNHQFLWQINAHTKKHIKIIRLRHIRHMIKITKSIHFLACVLCQVYTHFVFATLILNHSTRLLPFLDVWKC